MERHRVRIRFQKKGDLRQIGHRDLARAVERLFRRAELPPRMSEGFHPKPRMSFPSALGLGIAGLDEVMEVELTRRIEPEDLQRLLADQSPPGFEATNVESLEAGRPKVRVRSVVYDLPIPPERVEPLRGRIQEIASAAHWPVQRLGRAEPLDLAADLEEVRLSGDRLEFRLRVGPGAGVRPREVLEVLRVDDLETQGCPLTRTRVEAD